MNTVVQLSLPPEQLSLLEQVRELAEKVVASHNARAWLTEEEASERLRVSKSTLARWREAGYLRYTQDGPKIIRYRTDYLDADYEKRFGVKAFRK